MCRYLLVFLSGSRVGRPEGAKNSHCQHLTSSDCQSGRPPITLSITNTECLISISISATFRLSVGAGPGNLRLHVVGHPAEAGRAPPSAYAEDFARDPEDLKKTYTHPKSYLAAELVTSNFLRYMYVRMYVRMYVCMYVCMHVCLSVCLSVCLYVCMYVCGSAIVET